MQTAVAPLDPYIPVRRSLERRSVRLSAHCRIGDDLWSGTLHDLSDRGAFFQPQRCLNDGEILEPEDAWMVADHGDLVMITLKETGAEQTTHGRVRWTGCSDVHRCGGLGLMFVAQAPCVQQ